MEMRDGVGWRLKIRDEKARSTTWGEWKAKGVGVFSLLYGPRAHGGALADGFGGFGG